MPNEGVERDPKFLIENGYLEKVEDFEYEGERCWQAGWDTGSPRSFVDRFLGRIFEMPNAVFPEELLRPEKQDRGVFVSGVDAIVEAQRRVALNYFEDGSVETACPPMQALLHIMAYGEYEGMRESDPRLRVMFTRRVSARQSSGTRRGLRAKQSFDIELWTRHVCAVSQYLKNRRGESPGGFAKPDLP